MKNKTLRAALCAALLIATALASASFALDFSAEFVEKEGETTRKGKIYMTAEKSRFELDGSGEIEVTRADKKVMWLVFPKKKVYVEEEFFGALPTNVSNGEPKDGGDLSREDLGYEIVDTFRLRKYLVTVKYNNGETQDQYYEWRRNGFPIPVKMQSLNGEYSCEYKKIKLAPQDPNLFAEPKGYRKISIEELDELETVKQNKTKKK